MQDAGCSSGTYQRSSTVQLHLDVASSQYFWIVFFGVVKYGRNTSDYSVEFLGVN